MRTPLEKEVYYFRVLDVKKRTASFILTLDGHICEPNAPIVPVVIARAPEHSIPEEHKDSTYDFVYVWWNNRAWGCVGHARELKIRSIRDRDHQIPRYTKLEILPLEMF